MTTDWTVNLVGQAKKADNNLSQKAILAFATLLFEMRKLGPYRINWPNYTKMKNQNDDYHCHIEKGRPTYVVCWKVDKKNSIIEVYYAGTHKKAPY